MSDNNTAETILIRENTLLPAGLAVVSEVFLPGWRVVKNLDRPTLARNIAGANWTFFCIGHEIRPTAGGLAGLEAFLGRSLYNCFRPIKAHPKSLCLVPAKDFVSTMFAAGAESGRGRGGEQDHADAATKVYTALISSSLEFVGDTK